MSAASATCVLELPGQSFDARCQYEPCSAPLGLFQVQSAGTRPLKPLVDATLVFPCQRCHQKGHAHISVFQVRVQGAPITTFLIDAKKRLLDKRTGRPLPPCAPGTAA